MRGRAAVRETLIIFQKRGIYYFYVNSAVAEKKNC